jgi:signal transduction histidine kinase
MDFSGLRVAQALDDGAPAGMLVLENARLEQELRATIRELCSSRARLVSAADAERRRIERDLHDGAQQRLVSLRVKLGLAEELLATDPGALRTLIQEIAGDAEAALDELHDLVHGIYPSLLVDRGLAPALKALAADAPVRVRLQANGIHRHPDELESAVYFCCAEAVQNAVKHCGRDVQVTILLGEEPGWLGFEVRDDGPGIAMHPSAPRSGLVNMRDRMGAVGGTLEIVSGPEGGTAVSGAVPTDRGPGSAAQR